MSQWCNVPLTGSKKIIFTNFTFDIRPYNKFD
jgi:hypothetical protein